MSTPDGDRTRDRLIESQACFRYTTGACARRRGAERSSKQAGHAGYGIPDILTAPLRYRYRAVQRRNQEGGSRVTALTRNPPAVV